MTPQESFYPRAEGLPWSRSTLGQNDSPGVVLSQDRMTPLESFYPRTELLPWIHSIPAQNDSDGDRSLPGQKDSDGVVLSLD